MLERLTADATKAVLLAQEEARRLGHNYIDTEILLLGLIALSTGAATRTSESLVASLKAARKAIETMVGRGSDFVLRDPPLTPVAQRVMEKASKEARGARVSSEHIFRALLCEVECDAVHILDTLSVDRDQVADALKCLVNDSRATRQEISSQSQEDEGVYTREEALIISAVSGLDCFIKAKSVPPEMLSWFDEKDEILGCYINAEDDLLVLGRRGICWYDGQAKTYIDYESIDSVEEPLDVDDPYLKLVLRPKGKVVMLPVLNSTEDFPDYVAFCEYLSLCAQPKVMKMDIQDIQSKDDLIYFLRQPSVQSAGFVELASWLESGGPKPSWLGPLKIAPETLNDPNVWRLFALLLLRAPNAADKG